MAGGAGGDSERGTFITGFSHGLPEMSVSVVGPRDGPLLFFLHGWPDDEHVWDLQFQRYAKMGYRCARVTMPHFAKEPAAHPNMTWRKSGYSSDEIADMLIDLVGRLSRGAPAVLVLHDWGCCWGQFAIKKCPKIAAAVVLLDVAASEWFNIGREPTLPNYGQLLVFGLLYQYWNIAAFWLSRVPALGRLIRRCAGIDYRSAWPYWQLHRDHLLHALLRPFGYRWLPLWQTAAVDVFPPCPTLFVAGHAAMLHAGPLAKALRARSDGSRAFGMDAGHWVMTDRVMMDAGHWVVVDGLMKTEILKPGRPEELHEQLDGFLGDLQQRGVVPSPARGK